MAPKKRVACKPSSTRHAKRQKASESPTQDVTASVDLTALNATTSPLLRLPAELRDQIWKLAFGEKMICVSSIRSMQDRDSFKLGFVVYDAVCDHPKGSEAWLSETYTTVVLHQIAPQPVCRQYWAETSKVFLTTCTFRVDSPLAFRTLATSRKAIVPRICRLMMHASGRQSHNFPMYWQDVFSSALVSRFLGLEGLKLTGTVYWGPSEYLNQDVVTGSHWKVVKLSSTIQSFQQHELKAKLTSVVFEPDLSPYLPPWTTRPINEAIRKNLLHHHPRHLSNRRRE